MAITRYTTVIHHQRHRPHSQFVSSSNHHFGIIASQLSLFKHHQAWIALVNAGDNILSPSSSTLIRPRLHHRTLRSDAFAKVLSLLTSNAFENVSSPSSSNSRNDAFFYDDIAKAQKSLDLDLEALLNSSTLSLKLLATPNSKFQMYCNVLNGVIWPYIP